jgi:putative ABC transport system substrate-binding protein
MKRASLPLQRREFIALLGSAAVVPNLSHAQQPPAVSVIARIAVQAPDEVIEAAFSRGLAEAGYVEGKNVKIERHEAGHYDRLPALAEEPVRLKPALIVAGGNVIALAVKRATSTIPILFSVASDPVRLGLVNSFAYPRGNATGIATLTARSQPSGSS